MDILGTDSKWARPGSRSASLAITYGKPPGHRAGPIDDVAHAPLAAHPG
jgi:hypothetical protein